MGVPHNLEAEEAVLSGCLFDEGALGRAVDSLYPEDFYHVKHKMIFQAACDLFSANRAVDSITLSEQLKEAGKLSQAVDVISGLMGKYSSAANIDHWLKIIKDQSALRQLIQKCNTYIAAAQESPESVDGLLSQAAGEILKIANPDTQSQFTNTISTFEEIYSELEQDASGGEPSTGVLTGLPIDEHVFGFRPGEMVLLVGFTNSGKTAMSLNWAVDAAFNQDLNVAFISLEMNKKSLTERVISIHSEFKKDKFRKSVLKKDDWTKLTSFGTGTQNKNLWVCDYPRLTINQIRAKLYNLKAKLNNKLDVVFIDYFQKIRSESSYGRSRQQELGEISSELQALPKQLNTPVVIMCQLNRGMIQREDKRPRLGDLREAGDPEQDADIVIGVHRPYQFDKERSERLMELNIMKGRDIAGGRVYQLNWQPEILKVEGKTDWI